MAQFEIFQCGVSLHPDTMGEPVYQIGTKGGDGEYHIVVSEGMTKEEANSKLKELQPTKDAPKKKSISKKKSSKKAVKKDAAKKTTKKKTKKKKASGKKKVTSKKRKKK
tara:strand:+ start:455 stop:781 length:327 start_codon:yes stop_codon:yes gene_type:complete